MAFQEFKSTGGRFTPTVSISRGGFGISVGFGKKYQEVKAGSGVRLYFDAERKAVGFVFTPTHQDGTFKLKPLNKGGFYMGARSFLVQYDVNRDKYEARYHPKEETTPDGRMFVIELKEKKTD